MRRDLTTSNNDYQIKPKHREKFKPSEARDIIKAVVQDKLALKSEESSLDYVSLSKEISEEIKSRLKMLGRDRYKYIVHVAIGAQKGQGVQAGCKSFWDIDTDAVAFHQYIDDNLFCLTTVWGLYVY